MKRRLQMIALAAVAAVLLPSCNAVAKISAQQAQDIALQEANTTAEAVQYLSVRPDREDGKLHYDVSFFKDGTEYEYEIDVKTGNIISFDMDATPHD